MSQKYFTYHNSGVFMISMYHNRGIFMMSIHHDVALTAIAVSASIVVLTTIVPLPSILIFATNVDGINMIIYSILNLRAKINPEVLKKSSTTS